jgi:hypothetical protein
MLHIDTCIMTPFVPLIVYRCELVVDHLILEVYNNNIYVSLLTIYVDSQCWFMSTIFLI